MRALFTVQRLTEGWDVLNLYDIVRLYSGRDTDFKSKKAGSSTTSEVQLIGRGVRYFPFEYKDKSKNSRKFDNDLQNALRILEEFYFYSDDDVKYISELSAELKRTGIIAETRTQKVYLHKFSDFSEDYSHIYKKALHILNLTPSSYFNFENLRKRFSVKSTDDFFDFINDVKIEISSDAKIEEISHKELLKMFEDFFVYCQIQLESYDRPFKGTEFNLAPFASCEWYALDNFWGTGEERSLIEFIKSSLGNLKEKYEKICLLRNEEVCKIFSFDDGQGFAPDFLLLLKTKNDENAYFQIFIEPKGEHLAGDDNDGWKEKFLEEISERYGFSKPQKAENKDFVLYGLPFFNEQNATMKEKFVQSFWNVL